MQDPQTASDVVRHDAIQPDAGQDHGKSPKGRREHRQQAFTHQLGIDLLIHRPKVVDDDMGASQRTSARIDSAKEEESSDVRNTTVTSASGSRSWVSGV